MELQLPPGHCVLVVDNGSPLGPVLAEELTQAQWPVVVWLWSDRGSDRARAFPSAAGCIMISEFSEDMIVQNLATLAEHYGPLAVCIYLQPATSGPALATEPGMAWLRQAFLLSKHLQSVLHRAATQGFSAFLGVTQMDGILGLSGAATVSPTAGGLFGLLKSLKQEWNSVVCRALDVSPTLDASQAAKAILAELHDPNQLLREVGVGEAGRHTLICEVDQTLRSDLSSALNADTVVVVSGGGRGITAQCVIRLAQTYRCKFILLGRSPVAETDPDWAQNCHGEAELKKQIMIYLQAQGEQPTPKRVQALYKGVLAQREVRATLNAIRAAGGLAHYYCTDVTDVGKLQQTLTLATEQLGSIAAILHGAGNLSDKRIEKKTAADFDLVYAAKVQGLHNLLACLSPETLNYLVLFSSVAGFYGNVGQTDYAIANEVLNKTAHWFKQRYPDCHVVAINWGPWESGMVTPQLKQLFAERQIETIPIDAGTQFLVNELMVSHHHQPQVVIGSPLVMIPDTIENQGRTWRLRRRLSVDANPFLWDHVIHQRPVLPAMGAITWMANAAEQRYPGYTCFSYHHCKVLKGIVFEDPRGTCDYVLDLQELPEIMADGIRLHGKIWSQGSNGKPRYHFSADLVLLRTLPEPPEMVTFDLTPDGTQLYHRDLYQQPHSGLFHGPAFQGVQRVLNLRAEGHLSLECCLPAVNLAKQGQFPVQTLNPYIKDVQIHALLIWLQQFHQLGCLPCSVERFEQYRSIAFDQTFYISSEITDKTRSAIKANLIAHDRQGKLYSRMEGATGTILPLDKIIAATSI